MTNKIIIITIIIILISGTTVYGGVLDFDFYGLSYHFDEEEAYNGAPMKLDNNGVWVYNPGFGFGYDFRENIEKGGFPPITRIAFFQDCADESLLISYVPENNSISGTSGSDLFFFHVSVSVNKRYNKDINITPLTTKK